MPEPMTVPTMTAVAIKGPSARTSRGPLVEGVDSLMGTPCRRAGGVSPPDPTFSGGSLPLLARNSCSRPNRNQPTHGCVTITDCPAEGPLKVLFLAILGLLPGSRLGLWGGPFYTCTDRMRPRPTDRGSIGQRKAAASTRNEATCTLSPSEAEGKGALHTRARTDATAPTPRRHSLWQDVPDHQWDDWRWQSQNAIRSVRQLRTLLAFTDDELEAIGSL